MDGTALDVENITSSDIQCDVIETDKRSENLILFLYKLWAKTFRHAQKSYKNYDINFFF